MTDSRFHLAQINVAHMLYPIDHPGMAEFVRNLDQINALAEGTPGFVWRLQGDNGNATELRFTDDPMFIVNMSVWTSVEALFSYVYQSDHKTIMRGRKAWFEKPTEAHMALWWIAAGHVPSPREGLERLTHLRARGPSETAFTFKQRFAPPILAA
ncbi:MAG: DUF3291 domain-containing protein [Pseudomonadota bacterium]